MQGMTAFGEWIFRVAEQLSWKKFNGKPIGKTMFGHKLCFH
jgi:hypothetical protein